MGCRVIVGGIGELFVLPSVCLPATIGGDMEVEPKGAALYGDPLNCGNEDA